MKPLIAVTHRDGYQKKNLLLVRLLLWFAGAKAVSVTAKHPFPFDKCQGIILLGGQDINPKVYGHDPVSVQVYNDERDALELDAVLYAFKHKVPLLGICRGMQMINVALGGSLYQEIKDVIPGFIPTASFLEETFVRRHVNIHPESALFHILEEQQDEKVNSLHHQGIDRVSEHLNIAASEDTGLVQAVEVKPEESHPFLLGLQWHPELIPHKRSTRLIIEAFVNKARHRPEQ